MKTLLLTWTVLASLALGADLKAADAFKQNQRLGRGLNIIGYDPLWRSMSQARFQTKHFALLKQAGFTSVRINLYPFRQMDRSRGEALSESWFNTLDWSVTNALAQGLAVILDLHEFTVMGQNPESNRERFLAFWRQLSVHCQGAPPEVMFEILNEPNQKLTPEMWNGLLKEALAIIRQNHPNRIVIVGPAFWNSVDHLSELALPENDRNLIVTVHYYKPMEFTHQGASWSSQKDQSGIEWKGTEAERKPMQDDFAKVNAWAKTHNRPIFLGEFGAYDKAPSQSRAIYTDAVARLAESLGWSWAYWQFDGDFILWDMKQDRWVDLILHALIPGNKP
jgi:endoglucanase